jgi:hypothetical protein
MKTINKKHICVWVLLAIVPATSFAHQQGLAVVKRFNHVSVVHLADTIPQTVNKDEPLPDPKKAPIVKKVPKSRRQVKPVPLPGAPVKPIIKPKIIKPVVSVGL